MGQAYTEGKVKGEQGKTVNVRFLVDSGITYTLLPLQVWRALGLKPKRSVEFILADGTTIKRQMSECQIMLARREGHTPVILGEPEDKALLGILTLEILGLILNPFTRKLQPLRMTLSYSSLMVTREEMADSGALRALREAQADTKAGRIYSYGKVFGHPPCEPGRSL